MFNRWMVCAGVLAIAMAEAHADKREASASSDVTAPEAAPAKAQEHAEAAEAGETEAVAGLPMITGPKLVDLGHGAEIDLPAGMGLFERTEAQAMLRKFGNDAESAVAVIVPPDEAMTWIIVIEADDVGYVSDRDADELDAASMLEQFKAGTVAQNERRKALGFPELFIDGWSEPPRYDLAQHHLVWGLRGHDSDGAVINFFTRFLGRNGYLSVNLIDDPQTIEASKAQALSILAAVRYRPGFRYEDHVDGDKDSGMSLTTLVLGGAGIAIAKKGGILVALALIFKKGFVFVFAAIAGLFKWLTGRRKTRPDAAAAPADEDG